LAVGGSSIFILEATKPGRLPSKVLIGNETAARGQLRKALESGQFERVVLVWETDAGRRILFDSEQETSKSVGRRDPVKDAAVRRARGLTTALIGVMIVVILFYAMKWALNP
jgi:hypothetical protein